MARKVKQYLSDLDLEMDEENLQTLSVQCEPATNTCKQHFTYRKICSFGCRFLGPLTISHVCCKRLVNCISCIQFFIVRILGVHAFTYINLTILF